MRLPIPDQESVLVIRTDFSDDAAWEAFQAAVTAEDDAEPATYVIDPAFAGLTAQQAVLAENADEVCEVFLADADMMSGGELAVLAVDLCEPGTPFRVAPRDFVEVAANLIIGNMDLAEYAGDVDAAGFYRGIDSPGPGD